VSVFQPSFFQSQKSHSKKLAWGESATNLNVFQIWATLGNAKNSTANIELIFIFSVFWDVISSGSVTSKTTDWSQTEVKV